MREAGDLHHALDATVIAAVTPSMVQSLSMFSQAKELYAIKSGDSYVDPLTGEKIDNQYLNMDNKKFPLPWDNFREELLARLSLEPSLELQQRKIDKYDDIIDSVFLAP